VFCLLPFSLDGQVRAMQAALSVQATAAGELKRAMIARTRRSRPTRLCWRPSAPQSAPTEDNRAGAADHAGMSQVIGVFFLIWHQRRRLTRGSKPARHQAG
jgi:hypothetical protein